MDGLGLDAGRPRQALGGAACGSAQQTAHFLCPQDEQDGVHERRLADPGTAREDERPAGQRVTKRDLLAGGKLLSRLALAPGHGFVHVDGRVGSIGWSQGS